MKLIDLLVKELPQRGGWPDAANYVVQDCDGTVKFSKSINFLHVKSGEWCSNEDGDDWIYGDRPFEGNFHHYITANDWKVSIVTREQYKTALAASKAVVGRDGWIEWGGGECPVEEGTLVDVRFRDGDDDRNIEAIDLLWNHENWSADIIAYRLHKPGIKSRANDDRLEHDLNECIGQDFDMPEWNGDGVPPIGCVCEMQDSKGTWLPVEIIAKNDGFTFGWLYDYRLVFFGDKANEFRPLRTEAEKAREKLAASLHIAAGASPIELNGIRPLYFKLADAIISGSVFGATFKAGK